MGKPMTTSFFTETDRNGAHRIDIYGSGGNDHIRYSESETGRGTIQISATLDNETGKLSGHSTTHPDGNVHNHYNHPQE